MSSVGRYIAAAFSVTAVVSFGKKCVEVASETQSAWKGLSSILNGQGKSFASANDFIQEYISDGLIPLNNAVTAYKNLAARGYSTEQIESVLTSLKDAAAFGRQASYSYGDAITSATEGLKNENSILVDNAGVTKNVSKMWEDYADSIGTTRDKLTDQQKIQAEVNGIINETKWQVGDAAKYADSFAGKTAKLSASFLSLKQNIGEIIMPIANMFIPVVQSAITAANEFCVSVKNFLSSLGLEIPDISAYSSTSSAALEAASSIEAEGDAAEEAAKKAKKAKGAFASFDEINMLSKSDTDSSSSGKDSSTTSSGSDVLSATAATAQKTAETTDSIFSLIKEKLSTLWTGFSSGFEEERARLSTCLENAKTNVTTAWGDLKSLGSPLKNWASGSLMKNLEAFCHTAASVFLDLFDSVNTVFSDIWNVAAFPMVQKLITDALPRITDFFTKTLEVVKTVSSSVKEVFDKGWKEGVVPVLSLISTVFCDVWDIICEKWDTYGKPVFDGIQTAVTNAKDLIIQVWDSYIKPCWDKIMAAVTALWEEHLKPLVDNIVSFAAELQICATTVYNSFIYPLMSWIYEKLQPVFMWLFDTVMAVVSPFVTRLVDGFNDFITTLRGVIAFISGVFSTDWSQVWATMKVIFSNIWEQIKAIPSEVWAGICETFSAVGEFFSGVFSGAWTAVQTAFSSVGTFFSIVWKQIKAEFNKVKEFFSGVFSGAWTAVKKAFSSVGTFFSGVWTTIKEKFSDIGTKIGDSIGGAFRGAINAVLSTVENTLNTPIKAINGLLDVINKVPGVEIPKLNTFSLPRLYNGGWFSKNSPTLSIVGDNKHEGEIVTPESKIREQVEQALSKFKGGVTQTVQTVKLCIELLIRYPDGKTVIKQINEAQIKEGRILLEL